MKRSMRIILAIAALFIAAETAGASVTASYSHLSSGSGDDIFMGPGGLASYSWEWDVRADIDYTTVTSASLTLYYYDDSDPAMEAAMNVIDGVERGVFWPFGKKQDIYMEDAIIKGDLIDDGILEITLSLWDVIPNNDFYFDYATLEVTGGTTGFPVPAPAPVILLASGLAGLAGLGRKIMK